MLKIKSQFGKKINYFNNKQKKKTQINSLYFHILEYLNFFGFFFCLLIFLTKFDKAKLKSVIKL
jgi:hypothetical protein